jgi:hypothetical protein
MGNNLKHSELNLIEARKLKYIVINQINSDLQCIHYLTQIYNAWNQIWQKVFTGENRNFKLDPDDFFRQKLVAGIFQNNDLVAFHFYSFFDLRFKEVTQHSYFQGVAPTSFDILRDKSLNRLMSMEYLTVMPEFRKNEGQIPWAEVVISLGINVLKSTNFDVAFGTARRDVKVNKMGDRIGFNTLQSPIQKYDYDCEVMYFPKKNLLRHPELKVQFLIEELWANRIDLRNNQQNNLTSLINANVA